VKKNETGGFSPSEMMKNNDNDDEEVEGETVCVCARVRVRVCKRERERDLKQKLAGNSVLNTILKPKTFHDSS
jgi:hypothetical protein